MLRPASIEPIVSSWPPLCSIACAMENAIDVSHSPLRNAGHGRVHPARRPRHRACGPAGGVPGERGKRSGHPRSEGRDPRRSDRGAVPGGRRNGGGSNRQLPRSPRREFPSSKRRCSQTSRSRKNESPLEYPERLGEKVRAGVVELLNQQLADALDLALQAKQAHWNVKGPSFIALHELFDSVVEEIVEHADDLAERAVELGGTSGAFGPRPTRHACPAPGVNTSRRSRRPSPGSVPRPERESMPRPGWATLAQFQRLEREADL
jgi:hypothetical protein